MKQVEITKVDGSIEVVGGEMNDKLFAYLGKARGWKSYRCYDDGIVPVMSAKDKELKDYCDHYDRINKAMSY